MNKIKVMNEDLANKIAAGEVVERIANVVKELVENSLDANSKSIKIELIESGTKTIRIIDDGIGMNKEDAKAAFLRHATSKIKTLDDLFFISSLGFRGEALPSIASVSKVTLDTSEGDIGTKIIIHGGKIIEESASDARVGTMFEINDLFYNTPARLKYLKSERSELATTVNFIEKIALSYPDVSFTLSNNDHVIIKTSGSNNLLKTIHEIYGASVSKNMLEIKGTNDDFEISGYISKPEVLKSNRNYITTIVNGRVVKNNLLNKVINDAYFTYKPDGKFPIVVLNINTDPTLIDVNIHPTKQDIKFSKMISLEDLIFAEIKNSLASKLLIPKVEVKTKDSDDEIKIKESYDDYFKDIVIKEEETLFNEEDLKQESLSFTNESIKTLELYPVGLVFGTYIVAQNDEGMYLIDQHAAEERVNYEMILKELNSKELLTTEMLIPLNIEFTPSDYLIFNEKKAILDKLGIEIEEFGINTIIIKSHPIWFIHGHEEETIRRIIDLVLTLDHDFDYLKFNDNVAASAACNLSVKANTKISIYEMEKILEKLLKCDNPYNCPHGRPTIITFTKYELEKMFKRVMN